DVGVKQGLAVAGEDHHEDVPDGVGGDDRPPHEGLPEDGYELPDPRDILSDCHVALLVWRYRPQHSSKGGLSIQQMVENLGGPMVAVGVGVVVHPSQPPDMGLA